MKTKISAVLVAMAILLCLSSCANGHDASGNSGSSAQEKPSGNGNAAEAILTPPGAKEIERKVIDSARTEGIKLESRMSMDELKKFYKEALIKIGAKDFSPSVSNASVENYLIRNITDGLCTGVYIDVRENATYRLIELRIFFY
jgi:hypothetical protein